MARPARAALIALLAAALPGPAAAQPPSARDTAAAVAREVFQEVEGGVAEHRWVSRDTTIACDDDPSGTEVSAHRDDRGIVRRPPSAASKE